MKQQYRNTKYHEKILSNKNEISIFSKNIINTKL